eukprot:TRINITY_DN1660_c0_g2_i5.p1 TRINITY_DN1660_c0_g2~~TRINITY_DN1660_c0_g2_i5.p1  ORF type:complete len:255 (-),score=53.24 TRINITY_DN1660_c0_g2_i5:594-1358(-)
MHIDRDTGYIAASLSPFLLGTAYTLQKAQKVRDTNVAMPIYQVYVALGMQFTLIFALLIADGDDRGHPHHYFLALLAGCVYAMAAGCSLLAIRHVGVSFSLVAVCVVSAMVSFFWGKVVFQESTQNIYLAMVGMVVVVFGIVLFAYIVPQGKEEDEEEDEEQVASAVEEGAPSEADPLLPTVGQASQSQGSAGEGEGDPEDSRGFFMMMAVMAGVLGGSSMAPMHGFSKHAGLGFLVMFGCGFLIFTMAILLGW